MCNDLLGQIVVILQLRIDLAHVLPRINIILHHIHDGLPVVGIDTAHGLTPEVCVLMQRQLGIDLTEVKVYLTLVGEAIAHAILRLHVTDLTGLALVLLGFLQHTAVLTGIGMHLDTHGLQMIHHRTASLTVGGSERLVGLSGSLRLPAVRLYLLDALLCGLRQQAGLLLQQGFQLVAGNTVDLALQSSVLGLHILQEMTTHILHTCLAGIVFLLHLFDTLLGSRNPVFKGLGLVHVSVVLRLLTTVGRRLAIELIAHASSLIGIEYLGSTERAVAAENIILRTVTLRIVVADSTGYLLKQLELRRITLLLSI